MPHSYETDGAAIYRQSFRTIRAEADLARFSPEEERIAVRMIHAAGMVGLERQNADKVVWGASYFRNSFGQPSGYLYGGKRYDSIFSYDKLFAQWTVGLLYGYKPPYDHKVPLNHNGYSPGAVLSLGWQFTPTYSAQVNVLGNSALMFQFSADFK